MLGAEYLHTEDAQTGGERDGVLVKIDQAITDTVRVEVGMRRVTETVAAATPGTPGSTDITSLRGKITTQIPYLPRANSFLEYEQDVNDTDKKLAAAGGEYQFANRGKLYARHEFISSLQGAFALNQPQRQNATVVGLSTDYMQDGQLFSEYRARDAFDGRTTEAAIGLRNGWGLGKGLRLNTNVERIHVLSGSTDQESQAFGVGIEYTANPLWKGSASVEWRTATTSDSYLNTLALAAKLSRDWTFLGKQVLAVTQTHGINGGDRWQERIQFGLAYRDTDTNVWNGLGRIEYKHERDSAAIAVTPRRDAAIASVHANVQPVRDWSLGGRYAIKHVREHLGGVASRYTAHLIASRITWDLNERWDVGLNASIFGDQRFTTRQYGVGVEVGYLLVKNLWGSVGANLMGFRDPDFTTDYPTQKGLFLRLRYKFDEDLLTGMRRAGA